MIFYESRCTVVVPDDVAEDLMPPKFATKPEFSYAYDFVWEGIDAVFPGDKSGDFELVSEPISKA